MCAWSVGQVGNGISQNIFSSVKMPNSLKTFVFASHFYFRSPVYKKKELL